MSDYEEYTNREKELLLEILKDEEVVDRIQNFARDNGYADTDKETYQERFGVDFHEVKKETFHLHLY